MWSKSEKTRTYHSVSPRPRAVDGVENQEENVAMKECYFCKGKVIKKKIRHVHHWNKEIVIFENVPAEVCTQCGEMYFSPDVLEMMDNAMLEHTTPDKSIEVPVYSLS